MKQLYLLAILLVVASTNRTLANNPKAGNELGTSAAFAGDPSAFGNNVWNVYAWNAGDAADLGQSWNINFAGYYVEPLVSFDTRNRWDPTSSPSFATGYQGDGVFWDNHSWSAKRQGFACGHYKISIPGHDDEGQLFIDGVKVWEHIGCCDPHPNVWEGDLGPGSKIEFRCTEGAGGSYGVIAFDTVSLSTPAPVISSDAACAANSITLTSSIASGNQWFLNGAAIDGATSQTYVATVSGTYTVKLTSGTCASAPLYIGIIAGDPTVFGNGVWNVYAWNAGNDVDNGQSWNTDYSGYYADTALNLDTRNKWGTFSSPSSAPGYQGCIVGVDNHSWSAKRQGFPCGHYKISIVGHDDEGQLFVNGMKAWEHIGCCDPHDNVWEGDLGPNSKIEFRGTEGGGASYGALTINYVTALPTPVVSTTGNCHPSAVELTSNISSGNQWFLDGTAISGATSQLYLATTSGSYSVQTITPEGCMFISAPFPVAVANAGDPSVFGSNVWNVYAWNAGDAADNGQSWNTNYSGYYADTALNMDTRARWNDLTSPSSASGYIGCAIGVDNHSWSARRQGFTCGRYKISIVYHDDEAQLFIDGIKVWEHIGSGDPHPNVWEGQLGPDSKVEFRGTEGGGASSGAISFDFVSANPEIIPACRYGISNVVLTSSNASGNQWLLNGTAIDGATGQTYNATAAGSYSVRVTAGGCTATSSPVSPNLGLTDPSVFGNNVWNVYAWNAGNDLDTSQSWKMNYTGYYVDTALNMDTRGKWDLTSSPSSASGYIGCTVGADHHSWSARRQGFPCGHYNISIVGHDDGAQLLIDGVSVWNHLNGCCDSHPNVWDGDLGPNSRIEFRATEGTGGSFGAISMTYVATPSISSNGTSNCSGGNILLTSSNPSANQWFKDGTAINGATGQAYTATVSGKYFVQVTAAGCTRSSAPVSIIVGSVGDPSVFGDNVWNVYAWNAGGASDTGQSWNTNYKGFYVDSTFNFDTRNKWNSLASPSSALTYQGCPVGIDNHSWSAKRKGFPCDHYKISVLGHDDAAQLYINGVKVWEHNGCCDSHNNVWEGDLGANSLVEFRATEGTGDSYGAISFATMTPVISANGATTVCYAGNVTLSSNIGSGNQWYKDGVAINGATAQTYVATVSGSYTTQTGNSIGCAITSNSIAITVGTTPPPGDPSVFGDNQWNVYAWNSGGAQDTGKSWNTNYSGYYTVTTLNFNTQNQWNSSASPSSATGYLGCPVGNDNHSWAAKRKGFPCDYYRIDIPGHDDQGELWINGTRVWQHIGCCDSHTGVWTGFLGTDDQVEFRVTEGGGASFGSITFNTIAIALTGPSKICYGSTGDSISAPRIDGASYLWSPGGETSSSISNVAVGVYSVTISKGGCSVAPSFTVDALSMPPTITGITTICEGSSTTLTAGLTGPFIWNSGSYTFVKTVPGQTDDITANTHLTRGSSAPIYNAVTESFGSSSCSWTPGNTEWAFGNINDWASLSYQPLWTIFNCSSPARNGSLNQPIVLHLVAENIYLQLTFTYWQDGGGGNFTYVRTTGPSYSWSTGDTTPTISVSTSGTYSLTVPKGNACATLTASTDVTVKPLVNWYFDNDHDGHGGALYAASCDDLSGAGYVSNNTDCNDNDVSIHAPVQYYIDADGDEYGSTTTAMLCSLTAPAGYSTNSADCDDNDAAIHPGAPEICDGKDNNCDGVIDEGCGFITVTANKTAASSCADDGTITLNKSGGTSPFTYSIDGLSYQTSNKFTGLSAGTYVGFVKDSKSHLGTLSGITITKAAAIVITVAKTAASFCADDGTITITRTGGTSPFTYSIDGVHYQTSNKFTGLAAATYAVYVKDARCPAASVPGIVVSKAAEIVIKATPTPASSCADDGEISVTRTGGSPPFTFSVDGGNYQTSNKFTGLAAGTYTVYVKDAKCPAVSLGGIVVKKTAPVVVKANKTNATACHDDGTITLLRTGGTSPFTYSIDGVNYQTSNKFTGLAAGTYTGYVKDSKCPAASLPGITISTPVCNSISASSSIGGDAATIKAVKTSLVLFPNPANNVLHAELRGYSGDVTLQIRNIEGKVLLEKKVRVASEIAQEQLNVSSFASDVYFLTAINEKGDSQTQKVVIAH